MPTANDRNLEGLPELAVDLLTAVEQLEVHVTRKDFSARTRELAERATTLLASINVALDQREDGIETERFLAIAASIEARLKPLLTRLGDVPVLH